MQGLIWNIQEYTAMSSDFTIGQVVLRKILEQEDITINTLGIQLGMDRSQTLYDIDKGKTQTISLKMAKKILAAFPYYSRSWLLSGEGEMLIASPQKLQSAPQEIKRQTLGSRIVQTLPVIPIEAKAGIGKGFLYDRDCLQDVVDVNSEYDTMEVVLERETSDRYKLFRVKGDSMTDGTFRSLCAGDIILCREVYTEDWSYGLINTRSPYVVIVIEEEGVLIKQLTKHDKKNETISLHSAYKDLTIDLKKVRAFYYVERLIDRHIYEPYQN